MVNSAVDNLDIKWEILYFKSIVLKSALCLIMFVQTSVDSNRYQVQSLFELAFGWHEPLIKTSSRSPRLQKTKLNLIIGL